MPIVPNQSTSSWGNPSIWTGRKAQWRGECSGSILWRAHIIHSHLDFTKETQPASVLNPRYPPLQPPPTALLSVCVYLYFTSLSLFINLFFSFCVVVSKCPRAPAGSHVALLSSTGLFTAGRLRMIDLSPAKAGAYSGCRMTGASTQMFQSAPTQRPKLSWRRWRCECVCQVSFGGKSACVILVVHAQISRRSCWIASVPGSCLLRLSTWERLEIMWRICSSYYEANIRKILWPEILQSII